MQLLCQIWHYHSVKNKKCPLSTYWSFIPTSNSKTHRILSVVMTIRWAGEPRPRKRESHISRKSFEISDTAFQKHVNEKYYILTLNPAPMVCKTIMKMHMIFTTILQTIFHLSCRMLITKNVYMVLLSINSMLYKCFQQWKTTLFKRICNKIKCSTN